MTQVVQYVFLIVCLTWKIHSLSFSLSLLYSVTTVMMLMMMMMMMLMMMMMMMMMM